MRETWERIPDAVHPWEVSNTGWIRKRRKSTGVYMYTRGTLDENTYKFQYKSVRGLHTSKRLQAIVAEVFLPKPKKTGVFFCYKKVKEPANNRVSNLYWKEVVPVWSSREKKELIKGIKQNRSASSIGRRVKRSKNAVISKMRKMKRSGELQRLCSL